jgi:hypothetical protein
VGVHSGDITVDVRRVDDPPRVFGSGGAKGWTQGTPVVNVVRNADDAPFDLDLWGLTPQQVYAIAGLVIDDRFGGALLDAVKVIAPELTQ